MLVTLYMIPYALFTSLLGVFGGLVALGIVTMGLLRCSFLLVLLITGDMVRFKSEQVEGLSTVVAKVQSGWNSVARWFK